MSRRSETISSQDEHAPQKGAMSSVTGGVPSKPASAPMRSKALPATRKKDDRKRDILRGAVKVFAEQGYHGCRISDVAEAAGVAYGLVYHYFGNKDGLLRHIFLQNWAIFSAAMEAISKEELPAREKIEKYIDWILGSYELTPEVIKVLLLEFGRTSRVGEALDDPQLRGVFQVFADTFAEAQMDGDLDTGIDPKTLGFIFFSAVESALVQLVLPEQEGPRTEEENRDLLSTTKSTLHGLFLATARARRDVLQE